MTLARITSEDPFAGLPEPEAFGQHDPAAQHLYFDDVNRQPPAERIRIAREVEAAAMAYDTRIQNSGGGDFDTATSHKIMMNSRGFTGEYRRSYCGFSAQPIAHDEARQHAAQLLVLLRAHHPPAGRPRRHRPRGRAPGAAPVGRAASADPAGPRRLLARDRPRRSSATSSTRPTATPSIATPPSSPTCWASRSPARTSPSSTTARWSSITKLRTATSAPAASAPRPSTAKACPRAAPSWSKTASSRTT